MGWGVAPIYLGKQPRTVAARFRGKEELKGYRDAIAATTMAVGDQMPSGAVIYFNLEGDDIPTSRYLDYYTGWMKGILDQGYLPGLYCSFLVAPHVAQRMVKVQTLLMDLDTSLWKDPGAPRGLATGVALTAPSTRSARCR
jgi:Domain of unknown function (DUF1906)